MTFVETTRDFQSILIIRGFIYLTELDVTS